MRQKHSNTPPIPRDDPRFAGQIELASELTERSGKPVIRLHFGHQWVEMTPEQAAELGHNLLGYSSIVAIDQIAQSDRNANRS